MHHISRIAAVAALTLPALASAQVTMKPDGQLRSLWTFASSVSGGNTSATTATLTGETVKQTDHSKWLTLGRVFYARDEEKATAATYALTTQYDQDLINRDYFTVGKLDYLRDRPANIASRISAYGGLGRHLIREDNNTWDVFGGFGYTEDRYVGLADVNGEMRDRYGRSEALLSENSNHKLTPNTTLRQKLEYYADLRNSGEFRAVFDTGLSVAMTATWQLTTGLQYRYNSAPGRDLKHYDVQFLTGVSLRFD
jgi:putative salt-induced outer membrane protein